jgi:hypothetical protein
VPKGGPRPNSGGRREGAGRKPGVPNRIKRELQFAAQDYTDEALLALVRVMRKKTAPPSAVIAAATAILDRGHGKPAQAIRGQPLDLRLLTDAELAALIAIHERLDGLANAQIAERSTSG